MEKAFDDVFVDCTCLGTKLKTDEYEAFGQYAIVDQGQNDIAGYTNKTEGAFTDVPAIVFGDHTRAIKFVEQPFFLGADGVKVLKAKEESANYKYLYFALKSLHIPNTGYNRHFKWLKEARILYPDRRTQQKIVDTLCKTAEILADRQRQLSALDTLVKARFVEMFGDNASMDRWHCCRVGDVADISVGVVIKPAQYYTDDCAAGVPAFRSLNIGEMYVKDNDWVYFTPEGNEKNRKSILYENDLAIVRSGAPGTACVVTKQYSGFNAIDIIIARPNKKKINSVFLCAFTNLPHGKIQIEAGTGGAAQQHFNIGKYKEMKLILPPIELQTQFAAFVSQVDKSKAAVQKSLDEAQLLFDSLMQKYFG